MAPIVGVPKREPCKQCGLPVFFAERLAVDGSFYHRKCLRCARCDSQLTPGSFYETEVDGVFCCETCPDEEKKLQRLGTTNNNTHDNVNDDSNSMKTSTNSSAIEQQPHPLSPLEQRQSFSEKLAMFQTNGSGGLLQKSLSDEEKSKSLKRLTELYSKNAQQPTTIDESNVEMAETAVTSSESSEDEDDDDDENDANDQPPALPNTAPPPSIETGTDVQIESPQVNKPKLPPIPSKANALNKIHAKMNGTNKRPRSTSQSSCEMPMSIAVNGTQSPIERLQQRRDSQPNNDEHDESSANDALCTPTKHLQSQNDGNKATASMTTSTDNDENKDDVNTTIESSLDTKENCLPLDALNSLTNVTKENDATAAAATEQTGESSQRHAFDDVHRFDDDHIKCDNTTIDSHTIEFGASVNVVDKKAALDTTDEEIDENNANSDTHRIDKSADNTNGTDEITMRRDELQQKTSSIRDNDRQNVVRSRLSQFEALLQSATTSPRDSPRFQRRKKSIDTDVIVTDKSLAQNTPATITSVDDPVETERMTSKSNEIDDVQPILSEIAINQSLSSNDNDANDLQQQPNDVSDEIATNPCHDDSSDAKNKPIPRQRATLTAGCPNDDEHDDGGGTNPPTPCKRKQKTPSIDAQPHEHTAPALDDNSKKKESGAIERKQNDVKYPNGLNPFGSDDEQDGEHEENGVSRDRSFVVANPKPVDNSNPFDSSDDEIELLKDTPTPPPPSQSSTKATPYKNYR